LLIRLLAQSDLQAIRDLATEADAEGFLFLSRFLTDLLAGRASLDSSRERFLGTLIGERLIAIGGVTQDPYTTDPDIGRLRHLYVRAALRGQGVGRALVNALEAWAEPRYRALRLRTDTEAAAQFYEHLGYRRVTDGVATHRRVLSERL
jgi:GNAT superfamily N-acetyltransferase